MVEAHQRQMSRETFVHVLGVHEEMRKVCTIVVEGTEMEMVALNPTARTIWVGIHVKLMTPEEAEKISRAGKNGLILATFNGVVPEMVVQADNGSFYPATKNDIVMSSEDTDK